MAKVSAQKSEERFEIFHANTIVEPGGVVIKIGYAFIAFFAVYRGIVYPAVTLLASGHFCRIIYQGYFASLNI